MFTFFGIYDIITVGFCKSAVPGAEQGRKMINQEVLILDWSEIIVFIVYLAFMLGIGVFFFVKNVKSTKTDFKAGLEGIGQDED